MMQKQREQYKESMKQSWFFEKINKIDTPLSKLTKKQRENTQINKIRNEKGDITGTEEIQRIIRSFFRKLYSTKLENLQEMDNFLGRYHMPKLNQDQISKLNKHIMTNGTETVIKSLLSKKRAQNQMTSVQSSIRTSKKN